MTGGDPHSMAIVTAMYDKEDGTYTVIFYEICIYDADVLNYSSYIKDVNKIL